MSFECPTPLGRLIDDFITAYRLRQWYELEAWEAKAKREIKAMAEVARRGIGQKTRFAIARLQRNFEARERAAKMPRLSDPRAVEWYANQLVVARLRDSEYYKGISP
jgi:hypothetical protein